MSYSGMAGYAQDWQILCLAAHPSLSALVDGLTEFQELLQVDRDQHQVLVARILITVLFPGVHLND
jgi:hypothetical protein